MFCKFVGAPDEDALFKIFDNIFERGCLRFSAAHTFNDPFEFKYVSTFPKSRRAFEAWHKTQAPALMSKAQRDAAWKNVQGGGRDFIFTYSQRRDFLSQIFVLCFAQTRESQLLWSHYTNGHQGFCALVNPKIIHAYSEIDGFLGAEPVDYRTDVPTASWFAASYNQILSAIIRSKSPDWSYEKEFRIAIYAEPDAPHKFIEVDPSFMTGIILGARSTIGLRRRALSLQAKRPEFRVLEVCPTADTYAIDIRDVVPNQHSVRHML